MIKNLLALIESSIESTKKVLKTKISGNRATKEVVLVNYTKNKING